MSNYDLITVLKSLRVPSQFGTDRGMADFFEQYPDGVFATYSGAAPAGWQGYRVYFGGRSERLASMFEMLLGDAFRIEGLIRSRVGGRLVLSFRCRARVPSRAAMRNFGQYINNLYLNFTMPNGGTITLTRTGSPTTVELEYSLDNCQTWTVWEEVSNVRSLTLTAGQRVYIRNTSETDTEFSNYTDSYYKFAFTDVVYADGDVGSLKCKYPNNAVATYGCFISLFDGCSTMVTPPRISLTETNIICFYRMFFGCTNMISIPTLHFETVNLYACASMFRKCSSIVETGDLPFINVYNHGCESMFDSDTSLRVVKTRMETYESGGIYNWLNNVYATGDFYCPAELTIPTGVSGIPSGWTRHDI